jgi:hypothetical protein
MSQAMVSARARTCAWVGGIGAGRQRRIGAGGVEIGDDRQALGQAMAVNLQHGHEALRVEGAKDGVLLRAVAQIDAEAVMLDSP